MTVDALNDALWGDELKADVSNSLHQLVRTTRRLLGDEKPFRVLVRDDDAYLLVAHPVCVDALRFRRLAQRGGQLLASRPAAGRAMLAEALSMWRGPLLGTLAEQLGADRRGGARRVRLAAQLDLNEARLALGEHVVLEREIKAQINASRRRAAARAARARAARRRPDRRGDAGLPRRGPRSRRRRPRAAERRRRDRIRSAAARRPDAAHRTGRRRGGPVARPEAVVLCAVWQQPPRAGGSGVGKATLVVDDEGGRSSRSGRPSVAAFDDLDAALRAAAALARRRAAAGVALHVGGAVVIASNVFGPALRLPAALRALRARRRCC